VLNLPRVLMREAAHVAIGTGFANSKEPLPLEYYEAVSLSPETAEKLMTEMNRPRERAMAIERAKSGM
jgi:hypothetical protein